MDSTDPGRSPLLNVTWALAAASLFVLLVSEASANIGAILVGLAVLAAASQIGVPATSGNRLSLGFAVGAAIPFLLRTNSGDVDLIASGAVFVGGALVSWAIEVGRGREVVQSLATSFRSCLLYTSPSPRDL